MAQSEHDIQVKLMQFCHRHCDERLKRIFAIPNGGYRSKGEATRLKAEGVKRGVSDLMLPVPINGYHGLFIELKTLKGRASPEQKDWVNYFNSVGYRAEICKGLDEAIDVIIDYMGIQNK